MILKFVKGLMKQFTCYDIVKDTCDARCQGCSSCPIAESAKIAMDGFKAPVVTRLDMLKYAIKSTKENLTWQKFLKENDEEINVMMEKFKKECYVNK